MNLPVTQIFSELSTALSNHNQIILQAATGSGKSTAVPLWLLNQAIDGKIILLEPRRLAVKNLAHFLASQLGEAVGQTVGYRIRGEQKVSKHTRIEVITEGLLTRLCQQDPELKGVGLILFDEFHERHLHTDVALALSLDIQAAFRDDLKILLMSATLDAQALQQYLPDAYQLASEGRQYPVSIHYKPKPAQAAILPHCVKVIESALLRHHGSILVFLPGKGEINALLTQLEGRLNDDVLLCPLHGSLSLAQQRQAIEAPQKGFRKVVLTTNIAESSLTIEGVTVVIDSGLVRETQFSLKSGCEQLNLTRISQAAAQQRAGRAGRIEAGSCYRLWSEGEFNNMPAQTVAEIHRSNLSETALECVQWGSTTFDDLALMEQPPKLNQQFAWQQLQELNIIDADKKLTSRGKTALGISHIPWLMQLFSVAQSLESNGHNVLPLAAALAAIFEAPQLGRFDGADLAVRVHSINKVGKWKDRYQYWCRRLHADKTQIDSSYLSVLLGLSFPMRIAKQRGREGQYLLASGKGAALKHDDPLANIPYLVVFDLMALENVANAQISLACELLEQHFDKGGVLATLTETINSLGWQKDDSFTFVQESRVGRIVLKRQKAQSASVAEVANAFRERAEKEQLAPWFNHPSWQQFSVKLSLYEAAFGEPLMTIEPHTLLNLLEHEVKAKKGKLSWAQFKQLNLFLLLQNEMDWALAQRFKTLFPTEVAINGSRRLKVDYRAHQGAVICGKLQWFFGVLRTPTIAEGKIELSVEMLSPAQRPLAITKDLAGFWHGAYQQVKKEMKGRYPKHPWPDNPTEYIEKIEKK